MALTLVCLIFGSLLTGGLAARLPTIVGGADVVTLGKWPFVGSLQVFGMHNCGCALVGERWIVTAAHCLSGPASSTRGVFGTLSADSRNQEGAKFVDVERLIRHPDYLMGSGNYPNDLALLHTTAAVNYMEDPVVDVVPLATMKDNLLGAECYILGWGSTTGKIVDPGFPDLLQEARVGVIPDADCQEAMTTQYSKGNLCVLGNTISACQGDSGGPLVCKVSGSWILSGVTSFGDLSCSTDKPSVYTSIAWFHDWLSQEMTGTKGGY